MVAGPSSCSCPSCGVVCTGKFPACSDVWARWEEPASAALSGPAPAATPPAREPASTPSAANGHAVSLPDPLVQPLDADNGAKVGNENGAGHQDLLAEMRSINERIEQVSAARASRDDPSGDDVQARLLAQLERLPDQIARGLAGALREQHQLIMRDVKSALDNMVRQLTQFEAAAKER